MAHQTRISGQFAGENARTYTWIIYSEVGAQVSNQTGVCLIDDSFELTYESGTYQEVFKPIVASSVRLSLLATSNDMLASIREMATNDEAKTYIEVYDDQGWKWVGHILPEGTSILVTDGMTEVTLQFADGLQLLKSLEFVDDTTGTYYTGSRTALAWMYEILHMIPWMNEMSTSVPFIRDTPIFQNLQDVYDPDDDGAAGVGHTNYVGPQPIISDWACPAASFRTRPESETPDREIVGFRLPQTMSAYEVLEDILISLGCRICWNGYEWHVFSPLNYTDEAQGQASHESWTWSVDDLTTNGTAVAGTYDVFQPYVNLDTRYALRDGAILTYGIPARKTVITHSKSGQYIVNPATSSWDWIKSQDVPASNFAGNDEDANNFEFLNGLGLGGGEDINFKFDASIVLPNNSSYNGYHPCFVIEIKATATNGDVYYADKPLELTGSYDVVNLSGATVNTVKVAQNSPASWTTTPNTAAADDGKMYFPVWIHDAQSSYDSTTDDLANSVLVNNIGVQYSAPAMTRVSDSDPEILIETQVRRGGTINVDGVIQLPDVAIDELEVRWGFAVYDDTGAEVDNMLNRATTDPSTANRGDWAQDRWFDDLEQHRIQNFELFIDTEGNDVDIYSTTEEGSFDVINLGNTVVGTGYSTVYNGPGYWRTLTGPSIAGNTFGTVTSWLEDFTLQAGNTDNLRLLSEYWMRFLLANAEGVSFRTASTGSTVAHDLITPDMVWNTGCVTGTQSQLLPSRIIWRNTSSYQFEGIIIDYDTDTDVELESDNGGKGRIDVEFNNQSDSSTGKPGINPFIDGKIDDPSTKAGNNVLAWNGSSWIGRTPSGVASYTKLDDIGDVSGLTRNDAASNGKVLAYNNTSDSFEFIAQATTAGTSVSASIPRDPASAVDTFSDSDDGAEYVYKLKDSTNGYVRAGRLIVAHDGTDAHVMDQSTITMGGETTLPSFSATVSGGTVTVFCTNGNGYTFTANKSIL